MRLNSLSAAIMIAALGIASNAVAADAAPASGSKFKGSVEAQYRSNSNISVAPSSGAGFNFADGHGEIHKWQGQLSGFKRSGGEVVPNNISWLPKAGRADHEWVRTHIAPDKN